MVQILPQAKNIGSSIGSSLGQGLGQGMTQGANQQYQRGQIQQALGNLNNLPPDASPQQVLTSLISATAGIPGAERYVGPLYESLMTQRNRQAAANVPLAGGGVSSQGNAPRSPQNQNNQQFGGKIGSEGRAPSSDVDKFFPTNVGPNEAPGNLPQEATGGQIVPVKNGDEVLQEGQQIFKEWLQQGRTDARLEDAVALAQQRNQGNIEHNKRVEGERQNRIEEQNSFGQIAENELLKQKKDASPEMIALFRKKGEDVAGQGKSQAVIHRTLTKDAEKFQNDYSNAKNGIMAPRIQNLIQRKFSGDYKTPTQAMADAKKLIEPFVKEGLYDDSRQLLAEGGFYPEEREQTIFGLPQGQMKQAIDAIPKPSFEKQVKFKPGSFAGVDISDQRKYTPQSKENLKSGLRNVWGSKENKYVNPLLLRKEVEDLGYDWRIYKDALNEEIEAGNIVLTGDQQNQFNSYLNSPPLSNMEKILFKLDLRGR